MNEEIKDVKTKKPTEAQVRGYIREWDLGKQWIDNFTRDFPDLGNLADAVSLSNNKNAPMVGDVTLATSVRQIPRASIQQVPTMTVEVNGTKMSIPAYVCDFLVRRMVFNQDTFGKGILSTMQIGAESALTHGFQADMASIGNVMNDFGSTLNLIHYNDIVIEPGVFDANDSDYFHVRTRVTKSQLKKILKAAKANPDTTWDVEALQELLTRDPNSDSLSQYLPETRSGASNSLTSDSYDIITRYKSGPYAEICVFSLALEKSLRATRSNSKFGYPRVGFLVIDPAQLTPFGVSRVRLASPTANYANIYLQSTAKMLLMNSDPPVFQRGTFTTPIRMKRGALWQSADPNAEVKLQELSNSTLTQFQTVLQFVDNQIYSIMGVTPGTVGSGNTSQDFSKTAAGVKMEQATRDMSTTQVTNIVEGHIRQYALTALDLFISEQEGETPLIVDDKCKNAINDLVPETIGDDNVIEINWKEFYDSIQTWTVDIDLSMGKNDLEDKKRADLQDMLTVISQTADPNDPEAMNRKKILEKEILQQTAPEIAKQDEASQPQMPQQAPMGPQQS
jgi:hypothetical protein